MSTNCTSLEKPWVNTNLTQFKRFKYKNPSNELCRNEIPHLVLGQVDFVLGMSMILHNQNILDSFKFSKRLYSNKLLFGLTF